MVYKKYTFSLKVKHKNCSKLMERMKFGIKMHKYALRNGEIKLIRSHAKINVKSHFGGGGLLFALLS